MTATELKEFEDALITITLYTMSLPVDKLPMTRIVLQTRLARIEARILQAAGEDGSY